MLNSWNPHGLLSVVSSIYMSCHLLFLKLPRTITNLLSRIQSVGTKYGLNLPSASRVRKIGATSVALNLGDSAQAHLVTRQMSHSVSTDAQYYQAIVGHAINPRRACAQYLVCVCVSYSTSHFSRDYCATNDANLLSDG